MRIISQYVPQIVHSHDATSGAERFRCLLTHALAQNSEVLMLDEPTNHLVSKNRQSRMRLLEQIEINESNNI